MYMYMYMYRQNGQFGRLVEIRNTTVSKENIMSIQRVCSMHTHDNMTNRLQFCRCSNGALFQYSGIGRAGSRSASILSRRSPRLQPQPAHERG